VSARIAGIDFEALDTAGYAVLPGLVRPIELERFERDIDALGESLAERRRITVDGGEPIAAVLRQAGSGRGMLFDHIKHLFVLERTASEIAQALEDCGLFTHSRIRVPIAWPTLRADLPGERTYTFPLHQDYNTTRCATAWRLWVPLRAVDRHHGSMAVVPGSHRRGPWRYVTDSSYPHIDPAEIAAAKLETVDLELPAGDGILFDPRLVHGSIPNHSDRTKWVLLLHVQDMATFVNPDDPADPLQQFLELTRRQRTAQTQSVRYVPSETLVSSVLAGILAPLPFVAGLAAKAIPGKETAVRLALGHAIPMSLRSIAMTQQAGATVALTKHGELTEETKQSLLRRIAAWFVPDEVKDITAALQQDVLRLARAGFGEDAWRLEARGEEIVLVVLDTSFLKVSADTVAETFMDSFERLKAFKDKLPLIGRKSR
jgi:hypothetical protein